MSPDRIPFSPVLESDDSLREKEGNYGLIGGQGGRRWIRVHKIYLFFSRVGEYKRAVQHARLR